LIEVDHSPLQLHVRGAAKTLRKTLHLNLARVLPFINEEPAGEFVPFFANGSKGGEKGHGFVHPSGP
jgi:hypothetical protein